MQIIDNIIDNREIIGISPLRKRPSDRGTGAYLGHFIFEFEVFTRTRNLLIQSATYYTPRLDILNYIKDNIAANQWQLRYAKAYREVYCLSHNITSQDEYPKYILKMEQDCKRVIEEMELKIVLQQEPKSKKPLTFKQLNQ